LEELKNMKEKYTKIKTDEQLDEYIKRVDELLDIIDDFDIESKDRKELEILSDLIIEYEDIKYACLD